MTVLQRVSILFCLTFGIFRAAFSQLLVESFDYAPGQLTSLNNGANVSNGRWISLSGTGNPITVSEGSLFLDGYPSSGGGNRIDIRSVSSSAEDAYVSFGQRTSGTTFVSFLLCVTDTVGLRPPADSTGDYFISLLPGSSATTFVGRLSIRRGLTRGSFQLGIRTSSQNAKAEWASADLMLHTTHLVVVSYCLVPGSRNDSTSLWLNPDLRVPRPLPLVSQSSASTSEPSDLSRLVVRQDGTDTPDASIDGIRVAVSWEEAPLPIELRSFTGTRLDEHTVRLQWTTQSEVNNFGFSVERSCLEEGYVLIANSFIPGGGTTLLPRSYQYTDSNACSGQCRYRLQQTDLDGTVHYSPQIEIESWNSVPPHINGQFQLFPNFPNPFNPTTVVSWQVPEACSVKLAVYDILGREVAVLVKERNVTGSYEVEFDAGGLVSGVYLCRLTAGTFTQTRKMILAK